MRTTSQPDLAVKNQANLDPVAEYDNNEAGEYDDFEAQKKIYKLLKSPSSQYEVKSHPASQAVLPFHGKILKSQLNSGRSDDDL